MHVGPAASASQTIFTRARRAQGSGEGFSGDRCTGRRFERPALRRCERRPAAPAAPNLASLSFARKLGVMNS